MDSVLDNCWCCLFSSFLKELLYFGGDWRLNLSVLKSISAKLGGKFCISSLSLGGLGDFGVVQGDFCGTCLGIDEKSKLVSLEVIWQFGDLTGLMELKRSF